MLGYRKRNRSDTENAIANTHGYNTSRWCVRYWVLFTYRRSNRQYKRRISSNNSNAYRCIGLEPAFSFLVFFNLKCMVLVFTATTLFALHLFHAAIATGVGVLHGKVPVYQFAHAIMQVYCGAYRGAEVKNG